MIPRHYLVIVAAAVCIKCRVDSLFFHRIIPTLRVKIFIPAVQTAALFPRGFNHCGQTAVAFRQYRFDEAGVRIVVADADFFGFDACKQVFLLFTQQLHAVLRFKLKRSKRLWNKAGAGDGNAHRSSLWAGGQAVIQIDHLLRKVCNSLNVFHCFGGQTHHKVELDRGVAALKRSAAGGHQFLFGDVFIDNIAQTLCSRLRSKGQSAFL